MWGEFASDLINGKFQWPKPGAHDDQAHPPIHPTKNVELADLVDPDEKKIYELVTIHFLACCAQDARGVFLFFLLKTTCVLCDVVYCHVVLGHQKIIL